jgi:anti-sigma B factor antagonist
MYGLTMSTRETGDHNIVELRGELDIANASQVAAELAIVCARAHGVVVVDLSGVEFVDSSGLEALVRAQRQARIAGSEVRLAGLRPQALRVLQLSGWSREFAAPAASS